MLPRGSRAGIALTPLDVLPLFVSVIILGIVGLVVHHFRTQQPEDWGASCGKLPRVSMSSIAKPCGRLGVVGALCAGTR